MFAFNVCTGDFDNTRESYLHIDHERIERFLHMGLLFLWWLRIFHLLLWMMLGKRVVGVVRTMGEGGHEGRHAVMTNWRARSPTRTRCGRERRWPTKMTQASSRVGQSIWECVTSGGTISIELIPPKLRFFFIVFCIFAQSVILYFCHLKAAAA